MALPPLLALDPPPPNPVDNARAFHLGTIPFEDGEDHDHMSAAGSCVCYGRELSRCRLVAGGSTNGLVRLVLALRAAAEQSVPILHLEDHMPKGGLCETY